MSRRFATFASLLYALGFALWLGLLASRGDLAVPGILDRGFWRGIFNF